MKLPIFLMISSALFGASIMNLVKIENNINNVSTVDYLYLSEVEGKKVISIERNGKTEIGPTYDRNIEAMHLFEMVKQKLNNNEISDCHETGYRSQYWTQPYQGIAKVFTYPAPATKLPRIEWNE